MPALRQHFRTPPPPSRRDGFALLITITLLAFLVLLLVSLAGLTRVETQVAANSQQMTQARQNALLALNIALGQLQKFAGPDQRTTASADLGDGGTATAENQLVEPKDGSRYWTGAWGNRNAWGDDATKPGLLNWLVSGNEAIVVTADSSTASNGKDFGKITSTLPAPSFAPDGPLPALTAQTTTADNLGEWRLLVGGNTAGKNSASYVVAPAQKITVKAATLPGFSAGDPDKTVGRYAWWVGDEGVKATTTLIDPIATRTTPAERSYSFITAQRFGIERVVPEYPVNDTKLSSVLSLPQLSLAGGTAAQGALQTAALDHYHDFTTRSVSVLADASRGGLKKDLTAWVDHGGGPADTDPIVPGTDTMFGMPQWGIIHSYAGMTDDGTSKAPVPQSPSRQGLNPVITYLRLGYGISSKDGKLSVHLYPAVVLWNPTSVKIKGEYEVAVGYLTNTPRLTFTVLDTHGVAVPGKAVSFVPYYGGDDITGPAPSVSKSFRFKIEEVELPPGRSVMFALKNSDETYQAGTNVLSAVATGYSATQGDTTNSAVLTSTVSLDATESVRWDGLSGVAPDTYGWKTANLNVLLRVPSTAALTANFNTVQDNDYQAAQHVGFLTNTPVTVPQNTAPIPPFSTQPVLHSYVRMEMGGSTNSSVSLRWTAHSNPRARQAVRIGLDSGSHPNFTTNVACGSPIVITTKDGQASAGLSAAYNSALGDPIDLVLSEVRPQNVPLFSLAQLQNANLSLLSAYPAYAVGNAITNPYLLRTQQSAPTSYVGSTSTSAFSFTLYDLSWHLNRALWDRYYFSTVPVSLDQNSIASPAYHLPNARLGFVPRNGSLPTAATFTTATAFSTNAANLSVNGGFNINSTSVAAWRALLSSLHDVAYDPKAPGSSASGLTEPASYPIPRYINPRGGQAGAWAPNDPWGGYRALTAAAIDGLAAKIVDEVKKRGPFVSLADFINRRISSTGGALADGTDFKGAIQSAIDAYDAGLSSNTDVNAINRRAPFVTYPGLSTPTRSAYKQEYWGGPELKVPYSSPTAFAPGYLSQADVLTMIGPVLAARSDTFVIRTYGEAQNPVTDEVSGRAWCEAVVQRLPDYVKPKSGATGDDPETWPAADTDNQTFGRRFEIVSFRWLTDTDI